MRTALDIAIFCASVVFGCIALMPIQSLMGTSVMWADVVHTTFLLTMGFAGGLFIGRRHP